MLSIANGLVGRGSSVKILSSIISETRLTQRLDRKIELASPPSFARGLTKNPLRRLLFAMFVLYSIARWKPNVIFVDIKVQIEIVLLLRRIRLIRIPVVSRWGSLASHSIQPGTRRARHLACLLNAADRLVVPSEIVASDLIERFHVSRKKLKVINNSVDLVHVNDLAGNASVENQVQSPHSRDKCVAVWVGAFVPRKDPMTFVKAIELLRERKVECVGRMIGDGPLHNVILSYVRDNKMEKYVELVGRKDNPYKYMNSSDMFVHTATSEGFGLVILEAVALGLPVIISDGEIGAVPAIESYCHCSFFRSGNAISLADAIATQIGLGSNNRDRPSDNFVTRFSEGRFQDSYFSICQELVSI